MGPWRILQDGVPVDLPTGQPRTLLIYLVLQPACQAARSTIVEQLWPDTPPDRGRRHLTDALYRLRRALSPALIRADGEQIALDLTHPWWVDVWAFLQACANPDRAERAVAFTLYHADLTPEITETWILPHRARLQAHFVQLTLTDAADALQSADYERAEARYRQLLAIDPLQEVAHRGLMQTLARRGRLAAALEQYDQLVDLLEQELAVPPSPATRELADQLFQELDLARRRAQKPPRPQMVGRVEERTALRAALDRAGAGKSGLVVLLGEAGIGKSTLLRDLASAAAWRGWQICWGEAQEALAPAPYAPLSTALEAALPEARASQLAASLPSIWLNLLARFLPPLAHTAMLDGPVLPASAYEAKSLPQALAQLLYALQAIAPLLLLLDDVQWGDSALWKLLDDLLPLLHQQRVLILLSARRDDLHGEPSIWQRLTEWDRTAVAQIVALEGLPPAALRELAIWHQQTLSAEATAPVTSAQTALHTASGGNPLLALELLAQALPAPAPLASRPTGEALATPDAIATLVKRRLQQLSPQARQAVELAAILGMQFQYRHWEALWSLENPYGSALTPHVAIVEQSGVLQIEAEHYRFAHALLHTAVLADMPAPLLRQRHRAALAVLAPPAEAEATLTAAELSRLLHHAQGAEDAPAVVRYALAVGAQALQAFSFATAEAQFTRALAYLTDVAHAKNSGDAPSNADDNVTKQFAALLGRSEARHMLADRSGEAADLAALRALPLDPEQEIALLMRLAHYQLATGDFTAAQTSIETALDQATALTSTTIADLQLLAGKIARERNQLAQAQAHITAVQERYRQANNGWGVAVTTDLLGGLAWDQGHYQQAAALHTQAADDFAALGDLVHEAQSLNNLGSTFWELGRYVEARATHERSILVCHELGNKLSEGDNIDNLGGVAWALGDYQLAIRHYQAALTLRESIDDQWGISISLSNLGSAYRMLGNYEEALDYYERSLTLAQQVGRKRSEAYIVHCQGQTRLALGHLDEAWALLQQALGLRTAIGDRLRLLETHTVLIEAALVRGDEEEARRQRAATLALLQSTDKVALRQAAYFAAFRLAEQTGEPDAGRLLALALLAQNEMAAALPPAERARFLQNVPLNRTISAAAARYSQSQTVTLAGVNGPVTLTWPLLQPDDLLIEDPAARRRHVLARLLNTAAAQAATPTHDQLAAALGVSRRTILRDLPLLASAPPAH